MAASFSSRLSLSCCSSRSLSLSFSSSSRITPSYPSPGAGERPHDPLSERGWPRPLKDPVLLLEDDRPLSELECPWPPPERVVSMCPVGTSFCARLYPVLLLVGRLDSELRPESDIVQDWLLRALRPPLYELRFSVEPNPAPVAGSKRLRLPWLSDRLPPDRGDRYCTELRFLGTTGLKAVGRMSIFSILCEQK